VNEKDSQDESQEESDDQQQCQKIPFLLAAPTLAKVDLP
jgi:hypothetical protein